MTTIYLFAYADLVHLSNSTANAAKTQKFCFGEMLMTTLCNLANPRMEPRFFTLRSSTMTVSSACQSFKHRNTSEKNSCCFFRVIFTHNLIHSNLSNLLQVAMTSSKTTAMSLENGLRSISKRLTFPKRARHLP